jgi:hypothetical protein
MDEFLLLNSWRIFWLIVELKPNVTLKFVLLSTGKGYLEHQSLKLVEWDNLAEAYLKLIEYHDNQNELGGDYD